MLFLPTNAGLSETGEQAEHCSKTPLQGNSSLWPSSQISVFICSLVSREGGQRPCSGNPYAKAFADGKDGKAHTETLLGDMWPRDLAQLSPQQLVTQLFAAYQVM